MYLADFNHGYANLNKGPSLSHPVPAPGVTVSHVTSSQVQYETTAHGSATRVIVGYEVTRFGVPMIGQYVNTGRGRRVTISPAVPGAQYRITAWALGDGRRSATPTVVDATTEEAGELSEHEAVIGRYSTYILIQHILAIITVSITYICSAYATIHYNKFMASYYCMYMNVQTPFFTSQQYLYQ